MMCICCFYLKLMILAEVPNATIPVKMAIKKVNNENASTAAVTYRLNIFCWPGRHQWSITDEQRAKGYPGRQVRAKLRLRSNIRVITRYYTEHVDGLAEADSPTTTNITTTSFYFFFFSYSSSCTTTFCTFTAITSSSSSTYYFFVFAASFPLATAPCTEASSSLPSFPLPSCQLILGLVLAFVHCIYSLALRSRSSREVLFLYQCHHHRHHLRYWLHVSLLLYAVSARNYHAVQLSSQFKKILGPIV